MLQKECGAHCHRTLALYWVAFGSPPRVLYAYFGGDYRVGAGIMVWAWSVDDAVSAVLWVGHAPTHPVVVCSRIEFEIMAREPQP